MKVFHSSLNDRDLTRLQADTFKYFLHEWNPENGLIPDSTREGAPSSIAAVAFALTVYPIGVERKYLSRKEAIKRTLKKLRFFHDGPDGKGTDAIGYRGFYYHFLDMKTGQRSWRLRSSTFDKPIFLRVRLPPLSTLIARPRMSAKFVS